MCGIVALLRLGDRPLPPPTTIRSMARALSHRGPDGDGAWADDDVQLAAVRLALTDPSHGGQPAFGCTRDTVAVVNGELWEHDALRDDLRAGGHVIDGRCDAHLVPHLHESHGASLVDRVRGMFALIVWDARAKTLLLARDRLGIKPLYYAVTPDFLVVGSETKAIFASGFVAPAIDRDALDDLFSLSYPCPPRSMFRGVSSLPPGHVLVVRARRGAPSSPARYWRAPIPPRDHQHAASPAALYAELRDVLAGAVDLHARADALVAADVSGGLDSSVVTALAARVARAGGRPPPTSYTLRFDDAAYDESAHARRVAAHLDAPLVEVPIGRAAAALLPAMIESHELPLVVPGGIGGLLLSARQRDDGVKAVLTGDGADELLGGYDVFRAAAARRVLGRVPWAGARRAVLEAASRMAGQPRGMGAAIDRDARANDDVARRFHGVAPPWFDAWRLLDVERAALLSPDGRPVRPVDEPPAGWAALVRDDVATLHPLDAAIAVELETRLPAWILVIADRSSMANGVEARPPLLDDRVVERMLALPPALKMRRLQEKHALREAARSVVPRATRRRRKRPFTTPIADWFFAPGAPAFVDDALSPRALADAGLFSPDVVRHLRADLATAPPLLHRRIELVLMLVLSTQLLWQRFVR